MEPLRPLPVVVLGPHSPFRTSSTPRGAHRLTAWALGPAWLHSDLGSATAQSMAPVIWSPDQWLHQLHLLRSPAFTLAATTDFQFPWRNPVPSHLSGPLLCCLCFQMPSSNCVASSVYSWKSNRHLRVGRSMKRKIQTETAGFMILLHF